MPFVPWRYLADWRCIACGKCCKFYSVVLSFSEWLRIVKDYGVDKTVAGLGKLFLTKRVDGSCIFLHRLSNMHLCGLQHMKPKACKLWPFKVLSRPRYGHANEAICYYNGQKLFVYADSTCSGITYGPSTEKFTKYTLKELLEIALGYRNGQSTTTGNIRFLPSYVQTRI